MQTKEGHAFLFSSVGRQPLKLLCVRRTCHLMEQELPAEGKSDTLF